MPHIPDVARRAQDPRYLRLAKEVQPFRERQIFVDYVTGKPVEEIAKFNRMTVEDTRYIINRRLRRLVKAERKWIAAEDKCRELAIENRQLLLRYAMADKRNFSHIKMPMRYREWFARAGVKTLGRLRAVNTEDLFRVPGFPSAAIGWAIMALDDKGLSHNLFVQKKSIVRSKLARQLNVMGVKP
jgi:hypothetical protein